MRKRNFFRYAFTVRATAWLVVVLVACATVIGVCKVAGFWFLAKPIMYGYLLFCTAYMLKSFTDWCKYRK